MKWKPFRGLLFAADVFLFLAVCGYYGDGVLLGERESVCVLRLLAVCVF